MTTEERVKRLEREVRWTRVVGALAVLALACVVLVGAGQDQEKPKVLDEVVARRIVVVDEKGSASVIITPGLVGISSSKSSVNLDFQGLQLLGRTGSAVGLYSSPAAELIFKDRLGRKGVHIRQDPKNGTPTICLFDRNQRPRCIVGSPQLDTPKDNPVHSRPESSVVLLDEDGKVVFKAPK